MQKIGFTESLDHITATDGRYPRDAYVFLRDALDFTLKQRKPKEGARHVSGQDLLEGVRLFALHEYGPMALTVLHYWGVRQTLDVGHLVFNLIEAGVFGKTERDSIEDFRGGYSFRTAFVEPFLPEPPQPPGEPADLSAAEAPKATDLSR